MKDIVLYTVVPHLPSRLHPLLELARNIWFSWNLPVIDLFRGDELSQALGRENAVHVAVRAGKLAALLQQEAARLAGFRGPSGNESGMMKRNGTKSDGIRKTDE